MHERNYRHTLHLNANDVIALGAKFERERAYKSEHSICHLVHSQSV